jgi:hypothetical protein
MYHMKYIKSILFFGFFLTFFACQEETNLGESLLKDEKVDIEFTSDFNLIGNNFIQDKIASYIFTPAPIGGQAAIVSPGTGMIGELTDPVFGKIQGSIYSKLIYGTTSAPSFKDLRLDSAFIIMRYDSMGVYGNKTEPHRITVQEITEDYLALDTIYSNKKLAVSSTIIGEKILIPAPKDSIKTLRHSDSTMVKLAPQIRIRLKDTWAKSFFNNPIINGGVTGDINGELYKVLKGIKITSSATQSLLGVDIDLTGATSSNIPIMVLYYTNPSTKTKTTYSFQFSSLKFNSVELTTSGTTASGAIGNQGKSDQYLYLQSINGQGVSVELPSLTALSNKIINHAELVLTVAELPGDNLKLYPPIPQLIASKNVGGKKTVIKDASDLINATPSLSLSTAFGGVLLGNSGGTRSYKIIITKHIKEILAGKTEDNKIFLSALNRGERPHRTVFYGAKNSTNPIKLRITYSEK